MIASFRHKGLKRFFEHGDARSLNPEHAKRIGVVLTVLNAAGTIQGADRVGFNLHGLKGDREGQWAVTVRANWRIVFRFANGEATDVDLVDYH
jgi:proteic killer suppression protein